MMEAAASRVWYLVRWAEAAAHAKQEELAFPPVFSCAVLPEAYSRS